MEANKGCSGASDNIGYWYNAKNLTQGLDILELPLYIHSDIQKAVILITTTITFMQ